MAKQIERLQLQVRFLLAACLGLALGLAWVASPRPLHRITLVDQSGQTRLVLDATGDPVLFMRSQDGVERVHLCLTEVGPSLHLGNLEGKPAVTLGAEPRGAGLTLMDSRQTLRAELRVLDDTPSLQLRDEKQTVRAGMAASRDGAGLFVKDETGRVRIELVALGNQIERLVFKDIHERPRLQMAGDQIRLLSSGGRTLWEASTH